jgi:hypothetical protein
MQETKMAKIDKEQFAQKEKPVLHKKREMIRVETIQFTNQRNQEIRKWKKKNVRKIDFCC